MRLFITTALITAFAQTAFAGSYSTTTHSTSKLRGYLAPQGTCSGTVLVGGCGYCIGGKIYKF